MLAESFECEGHLDGLGAAPTSFSTPALGSWKSAAFLVVILTGLDFPFCGHSGKLFELATLHV
jgi:hypothetical protein